MVYKLDLKKNCLKKKKEAQGPHEFQQTVSMKTGFGIRRFPGIPVLFPFWPLRVLSFHASSATWFRMFYVLSVFVSFGKPVIPLESKGRIFLIF